jgi:hypothetical protein
VIAEKQLKNDKHAIISQSRMSIYKGTTLSIGFAGRQSVTEHGSYT